MAIPEIPTSTGYSHQSIQTFPFFYVTALGLTLRHPMGRSDINDATSWNPLCPSFLPIKWQWWSYFIWVYGNEIRSSIHTAWQRGLKRRWLRQSSTHLAMLFDKITNQKHKTLNHPDFLLKIPNKSLTNEDFFYCLLLLRDLERLFNRKMPLYFPGNLDEYRHQGMRRDFYLSFYLFY